MNNSFFNSSDCLQMYRQSNDTHGKVIGQLVVIKTKVKVRFIRHKAEFDRLCKPNIFDSNSYSNP